MLISDPPALTLFLSIFYIVRNLISRIPFPFEGAYGFKHDLVKEREGDVIFVFILFLYQEYYVNKERKIKINGVLSIKICI